MKTNLDFLKTNNELEQNGIWFEVSPTTKFLVARFGGMNTPKMKAAIAKHYKPYARMIEMGTMDPVKEKEITIKVFVEACVRDWQGVEIDGKEVPFSHEACVKLFMDLPELLDALTAHAQSSNNYREDLGNS